jgi:serine O-acetyltransferase
MTTGPKISGTSIPLRVFTQPGSFDDITIRGDATVGDICHIRNGVVVGMAMTRKMAVRPSGDIGAVPKVVDPFPIGNQALTSANAVVIIDVPANCIAVGVPAVA